MFYDDMLMDSVYPQDLPHRDATIGSMRTSIEQTGHGVSGDALVSFPDAVHTAEDRMQVYPPLGGAELPAYFYFVRRSRQRPQPIPLHWHRELETLTVLEGQLEVRCLGDSLELQAQDVLLVNSSAPHLYRIPSQTPRESHVGCCFLPELVAEKGTRLYETCVQPLLENGSFHYIHLKGTHPAGRKAHRLLHRLYRELMLPVPLPELALRNTIAETWRLIASSVLDGADVTMGRESPSQERLQRMCLYIADHYRDRVSLDDLAACASVCRSEVTRCFKSHLDMTAGEYLLEYRISRACELLQTQLPIAEVASRCGFESPSYFGKRFKKLLGVTPGEYRAQLADR